MFCTSQHCYISYRVEILHILRWLCTFSHKHNVHIAIHIGIIINTPSPIRFQEGYILISLWWKSVDRIMRCVWRRVYIICTVGMYVVLCAFDFYAFRFPEFGSHFFIPTMTSEILFNLTIRNWILLLLFLTRLVSLVEL